ncbi:MAG: nucleotidyltransferase family protein [Chloroflexi bacterium]|nr:nucleotidyltransferase family protein [Chloroflexota bacterium]
MQALILAAGLGTRLGGLTADRPKCMLTFGDAPLIEHLVVWLRQHGIDDIAVNLHYLPETITSFLGDGRRFGVSVTYSYERELLGTAGAARKLAPHFTGPVVVVYGDGYTNLDLGRVLEYHAARRRAETPHMTMVLYHVPDPTACGIVALDRDDRVVRFVEKPAREDVFGDLASAGVLVLERALLERIPDAAVWDFGRDELPALLADGVPVYGVPLHEQEYLIDIGTPSSYRRASSLSAAGAGAAGRSRLPN